MGRDRLEPRDVLFHAMLKSLGLEKGKPFRPDARQTNILTDAALVGEAMAKAASAYLSAYEDKAGEWLDGGSSYRLRVPPRVPMQLFWSVTLYDVDTRALIRNAQKIADRSSRMDLKKNPDGSVDIYTGPTPPPGFEQNWIPTVPGRSWFAYFRFYNPTQPYFDRSQPLERKEKRT